MLLDAFLGAECLFFQDPANKRLSELGLHSKEVSERLRSRVAYSHGASSRIADACFSMVYILQHLAELVLKTKRLSGLAAKAWVRSALLDFV